MMVSKKQKSRLAGRVLAVCAMLAVTASLALAQAGPSGADLVRAGASAVGDGDFASAEKKLTSALSSDKLSSQEVSKAFYYRGIAYRRLGRLAQAVSDLNRALWLKGLTSNEKAQAQLNMGLAYRAAGLEDKAKVALAKAKKLAPGNEQIANALGGGGGGDQRSSLSGIRSFFGRNREAALTPEAKPAPAPETKTKTEAKIPEFRTTITPAETDETAEQKAVPAAPKPVKSAARTPPAASPSQWSTSVASQTGVPALGPGSQGADPGEKKPGRIGRFFGSLWEDDEEEESGGGAAGQSPAADWTKTTRVEEFGAPATPGVKRTYHVQLSSSRSEKEARDYWRALSTKYVEFFDGREPVIEKTELGTLGTFYRLQVGPFYDKQEPLRLCNNFKANGLDCFLVAR